MNIQVKTDHLIDPVDFAAYKDQVAALNEGLIGGTLPGHEYRGWLNRRVDFDPAEIAKIKEVAAEVKDHYEALVVCGIGGSYLGARAGIEALNGNVHGHKPEIIYLGQTFDPTYLSENLAYLQNKKFAVNVVSKSGTTTETAVSFRLLRELLEKRDGKEAARHAVIATTDAHEGALLKLATQEGYVRFVLPSDIGGRYSVQTAVGLFPLACAGIDPLAILKGSAAAREDESTGDIFKNEAYKYAVIRHEMWAHYHKAVEFLVTYVPSFVQLGEWWKQLFGESEGKERKSLLPDSVTFTTDLHSMGQYIQDGSPVFFETTLHLSHHRHDLKVPFDQDNLDGLNYLVGRSLGNIQDRAFEGTLAAHTHPGENNNVILELERMDAYNLGYLFYFFERACAMSAYLNGLNPFDQPGVEVYKKNMFKLLGKPGA